MHSPSTLAFWKKQWSPWKRETNDIPKVYPSTDFSTYKNAFDIIEVNKVLDFDTKLAALKVSQSVVGLESFTKGEDGCWKRLFVCSGFIILSEENEDEEEEEEDLYDTTIITSASFFGDTQSPYDTRFVMRCVDGQLEEFDPEFDTVEYRIDYIHNAVTIKVQVIGKRETVTLANVHVTPLLPGDMVVALGRHYLTADLMAAPGKLSLIPVVDPGITCQELCGSSCQITHCGIGGPVINRYGGVLGISFYHQCYTPFVPMTSALKGLDNIRRHGIVLRPWFGMEVNHFAEETLDKLEKIKLKFGDVQGLVVKKVLLESPAASAGIQVDDIIIMCNGLTVGDWMQFVNTTWYTAGQSVRLHVLRPSIGGYLDLDIFPIVINSRQYYRWVVGEDRRP